MTIKEDTDNNLDFNDYKLELEAAMKMIADAIEEIGGTSAVVTRTGFVICLNVDKRMVLKRPCFFNSTYSIRTSKWKSPKKSDILQ